MMIQVKKEFKSKIDYLFLLNKKTCDQKQSVNNADNCQVILHNKQGMPPEKNLQLLI